MHINSLFYKVINQFNLIKIIETIEAIPKDQWLDASIHSEPFLNGVTDGYIKTLIIKAITRIPQNQRVDGCIHAKSLLKGITNGYVKGFVIQAIAGMAQITNRYMYSSAVPSSKNR